MTFGYPRSDMVIGLEGQRSRLKLGLGYISTAWVRTLWVPSSFAWFVCLYSSWTSWVVSDGTSATCLASQRSQWYGRAVMTAHSSFDRVRVAAPPTRSLLPCSTPTTSTTFTYAADQTISSPSAERSLEKLWVCRRTRAAHFFSVPLSSWSFYLCIKHVDRNTSMK